MCKHVAAVLYGVGNRLDANPEALFHLRHTNHMDLIDTMQLDAMPIGTVDNQVDGDLSALFGIEFAQETPIAETPVVVNPKPVKSKTKQKTDQKKKALKE
jgi:uncharacterized Zn finger protein